MAKALKLPQLKTLTDFLKKKHAVYAPVPKDGETVFDILEDQDPDLGCAVSIMPPKRVLQPELQTLFRYSTDGSFSLEVPPLDKKQVLFGVRPCDVHAIVTFDNVFGGKHNDTYWQERRNHTLIVAANCTTVEEECFCTSWGTGPGLAGDFDLLLTYLGDGFLLETGSTAGEQIADELNLEPATEAEIAKKHRLLAEATASIKKSLSVKPEHLDEFLGEKFGVEAWKPQADVCFSCGNCTLVCPTCYCSDTYEDYSPAKNAGERKAEWDSCQLLEFSEIARGFNFRRTRLDRFKHRALHKLTWMKEQYGRTGCVGCGRCVRWCPSWPVRRGRPTSLADPVEIVDDLLEAE